jgi:NitT/TauT family transport system substrate-binding protein
MALKILPHGRLQEWVAEEKGYFTAEGLEYSFVTSGDYGMSSIQRGDDGEVRTGAFETFGAGRSGADVSCACHWATSAAARERAGHLVTTAYSVAPCAIVVPPESPIRRPEDLAGVTVGVGYHSGSHFATVQALEPVLAPGDLKLTFQGPPNERLDALLERQVPAATAWGVPLYVAEAFGFRKVLDATFMIGFLVTGRDATKADVDRYLAALRRAHQGSVRADPAVDRGAPALCRGGGPGRLRRGRHRLKSREGRAGPVHSPHGARVGAHDGLDQAVPGGREDQAVSIG